jgi:hypothetical protein
MALPWRFCAGSGAKEVLRQRHLVLAKYGHCLIRGSGKVALMAILIAALGLLLLLSLGISVKAVGLDEVTVVTMARDGSWGVGTAGSHGPAIAAAIRDCRAMSGGPSDCGAQFITSRGNWVIAGLCGSQKIFVTAATLEDVERAAMKREHKLNAVSNAAPCKWILTVNPRDVVVMATSKDSNAAPTD